MVRPIQRCLKNRVDAQQNRYGLRSRKHCLKKKSLEIHPTANCPNHVRHKLIKRLQVIKVTKQGNANSVPKKYDSGFVRFGQFGATKDIIDSTIEWYKKQEGIGKNARVTITAKDGGIFTRDASTKRKHRNRNLSAKRSLLKQQLQVEPKRVGKKPLTSRCRLTRRIANKCLQNAAGILQPRVTKTSHDNANSQCNHVPLIQKTKSAENTSRSANYAMNSLHSYPYWLRRQQKSEAKLKQNHSLPQSLVETESNTSSGTITSLQQKFSNFANTMNRFVGKFLEFWNKYFRNSEENEVAPFDSKMYRYSVPNWMCGRNISLHNDDYCSGHNDEDTSDQSSYEEGSQIYQNAAVAVPKNSVSVSAFVSKLTFSMPPQQKVTVSTSTAMSEVDGIAEVPANDARDEHGFDRQHKMI